MVWDFEEGRWGEREKHGWFEPMRRGRVGERETWMVWAQDEGERATWIGWAQDEGGGNMDKITPATIRARAYVIRGQDHSSLALLVIKRLPSIFEVISFRESVPYSAFITFIIN